MRFATILPVSAYAHAHALEWRHHAHMLVRFHELCVWRDDLVQEALVVSTTREPVIPRSGGRAADLPC